MLRTLVALVLIGAALVVGAAFAHGGMVAPEPGLTPHNLLVFLHELLFVFWLGPDIGVFLWSGKVIDPKLTVPQRLAAARIMANIDVIPRVAMSLMLTVGGILSAFNGLEHPPWLMAGIVLLGPFWLGIVLLTYFRQGTAFGATLARFDIGFRWALMAGIVASVAYSTATGRLDEAPWIGWKLLIFAALLFAGAMMRLQIRPFVDGIRKLATEGPSPAADAAMAGSLARTKPFVLLMWAGLLLAAVLGVVQPGSDDEADDEAVTGVVSPGGDRP